MRWGRASGEGFDHARRSLGAGAHPHRLPASPFGEGSGASAQNRPWRGLERQSIRWPGGVRFTRVADTIGRYVRALFWREDAPIDCSVPVPRRAADLGSRRDRLRQRPGHRPHSAARARYRDLHRDRDAQRRDQPQLQCIDGGTTTATITALDPSGAFIGFQMGTWSGAVCTAVLSNEAGAMAAVCWRRAPIGGQPLRQAPRPDGILTDFVRNSRRSTVFIAHSRQSGPQSESSVRVLTESSVRRQSRSSPRRGGSLSSPLPGEARRRPADLSGRSRYSSITSSRRRLGPAEADATARRSNEVQRYPTSTQPSVGSRRSVRARDWCWSAADSGGPPSLPIESFENFRRIEADGVHAVDPRAIADCLRERQRILRDDRIAADERVLPTRQNWCTPENALIVAKSSTVTWPPSVAALPKIV